MTPVPLSDFPLDDTIPEVLPAEPTFRDVPWGWWDVILGFLIPVLAFGGLYLAKPFLAGLPRWAGLGLNVLPQAWFLGYPLLVARWRGYRVPQVPRPHQVLLEAALALPLFVFGFLMMIALLLLWVTVVGQKGLPVSPLEPVIQSADRPALIFMVLVAALVAPVSEEVFFRGMVYNRFRRRMPWALAAVLQAAIFGLLHGYSLSYPLFIFAFGLLLTVVYEWRRTLLAPILIHGFQNSFAAIMTLIMVGNLPFLGVASEADADGARVTAVQPGSPAEAAGLRPGDVITAAGGEPVQGPEELIRAIRKRQIGEALAVEFRRDGQVHQAQAVLRRRE